MSGKRVAILKGGFSAEREVSLKSGAAVAAAARELDYIVTEIDVQSDIAQTLAAANPDLVFNALHGNYGEDGCVQGLLELMKIPYTHSGVLASALSMDKPMAKNIFESCGLVCPRGITLSVEKLLQNSGDPLPRPFVIKPASEGSSVGVHIIRREDNSSLAMIIESDPELKKDQSRLLLVEEYIAGREITVAVLDDVALGVTELRPKTGFYDYDNKYINGKTEHLCPAPLPADKYAEVMEMAVVAHKALGCRGLSRSDFRYDDTQSDKGKFYLLELNTQPGMTNLSLSPEIAAQAGISFVELVKRLLEGARLGK